jgi:hypothetical protein
MHPAIQAEIARQVALALRREREEHPVPVEEVQRVKSAQLITFPGAG